MKVTKSIWGLWVRVLLSGFFIALPVSAFSKEKSFLKASEACAGRLLRTPSAQGEDGFHHHLVRPGTETTYILQVCNVYDDTRGVRLNLESEVPASWRVELEKNYISGLAPGAWENVLLTVKPSRSVPDKTTLDMEVSAETEFGEKASLKVKAQTSMMRKIYFVSIDSLDPAYLKLNSRGTGYGAGNDWLMPNLHRFMERAVFYPNARVHIITATDMNHFNFLAGTMTGTSGISMVGAFFFGFDEKGQPVSKRTFDLEEPLTKYGRDGKLVTTLFNAAKKAKPQAWTAFISGKNWVPELMRHPSYQLDRIIHGTCVPFYIEPAGKIELNQLQFLGRAVTGLLPGRLPKYAHQLGNPAGLDEPQDKRQQYELARLISSYPMNFPPDEWIMDAALTEIMNEDPDIFYILLAAVDDAGHAFGSAFDLDEWDDNGTPGNITDDVSKYDPRASRQGILNVVREADHQFGRLIELLEKRRTLDEVILVVESDHSMVTHYRRALDMKEQLEKECDFSMETDYFFGTATSIGSVYARRDDPEIIQAVETALEKWHVKNPITGQRERAAIVYNRQEMKTGTDESTAKKWMLPGEYYSEYYINHRRPGEQTWCHLLVLAAPHYKFKIQNIGLANLGMTDVPIKIPEWGYFIGGHGSFEARPGLLVVKTPNITPRINKAELYTMDVAPTLYRLQEWTIPECVDGKGLNGIDPNIPIIPFNP